MKILYGLEVQKIYKNQFLKNNKNRIRFSVGTFKKKKNQRYLLQNMYHQYY